MQNDVLKNNIAPWQEQGRWYHAVLLDIDSHWELVYEESDSFFLDNDAGIVDGTSFRIATYAYHLIADVKFVPRTPIVDDGQLIFTLNYYLRSTYFDLPSASILDDGSKADFWVFIKTVKKDNDGGHQGGGGHE